ncbi:uncharacterized protein [Nicotiana tomentosiformis]|uniref:uncharacterized protein n=1 Tax=Nicotiana tomentosiformis TaxID=4098 RepID=UPI00388C9950
MQQPNSNKVCSFIDLVTDVIVDDISAIINVGDMLEAVLLNFDDEEMDGFMECMNFLQGMGKTPPTKPYIEEPHTLELKSLPPNLWYEFIGLCSTLPVILFSYLTNVQVDSVSEVLQKREKAIGWTLEDIRGINPAFCMHNIKLEDGAKPSIEYQRRLNKARQEVVKKEFIKWLDVGVIYPISDSYNKILIAPEDQEKTTFTCPYDTFTFKRILFDMVEDYLEVFMDDFTVVGDLFDDCLANLDQVLARCEETNLVLSWEKCHFMVEEGIILGHKISMNGIKVDKAKIELLEKDAKFNFNDNCMRAFELLKLKLTTTHIITAPN